MRLILLLLMFAVQSVIALELKPGETIRIEPVKKEGEQYKGPPSLVIEPIFIHNKNVIIPAKGTIQFGDGQTLEIKGSCLIMLPPRILDETILRINISGFQEWSLGLRYNVKERKVLKLPIELKLNSVTK